MDKRTWLKVAAACSFFMAMCQAGISFSPAAAAYFKAPPPLLENHWQLFWVGEAAALILIVFGLYAASGAGSIRRLPLLRLGLIGISTAFLLRGLFFIISLLIVLGVLEGEILVQGEIATLVFLVAGIVYAVGTVLNWSDMGVSRPNEAGNRLVVGSRSAALRGRTREMPGAGHTDHSGQHGPTGVGPRSERGATTG